MCEQICISPYTWHPESPRKTLQVATRAADFSWGQDQRVYFSIWEALDEVRQKWEGRGGENTNTGQRTRSIFLFMPQKKQQNTYFSSPSVGLPQADRSGNVTGLQSISTWVEIQGRAKWGWKRPSNWDLRVPDMLFHFAYCPSPGKDMDPPALWILHPCGKSRHLLR